MKNYIIVSESNKWLSTGYDATDKQIKDDIKEVRKKLKEDGEDAKQDLLLYEITGTPIHV